MAIKFNNYNNIHNKKEIIGKIQEIFPGEIIEDLGYDKYGIKGEDYVRIKNQALSSEARKKLKMKEFFFDSGMKYDFGETRESEANSFVIYNPKIEQDLKEKALKLKTGADKDKFVKLNRGAIAVNF
ncbi:MAG: hypothetical protein ACRC6B_11685, partial [Fusobacteriaceae bacterium]